MSDANRDSFNSQSLTVTVKNTLNDPSSTFDKTYTFTVIVKRAECDAGTITFTDPAAFAVPFITVDLNVGPTSTGTFLDAGYTKLTDTASEACGPRTYTFDLAWVTVAAPAVTGIGTTYTATADATG